MSTIDLFNLGLPPGPQDTFHVAYLNLTLLSPGSRQPCSCWRSSCHSFECALARALRCDVALTESKCARCQVSRWGLSPSANRTSSPLSGPTAAVESVPNLRVENFPIRLQDPGLNWAPGAPSMSTLKITYMLYAVLGLLQPVWGDCMGASPNRPVYHQGM